MRSFHGGVLLVVVVAGMMLTGCSKKESGMPDAKAHRLLIEGTVFLKQGDVLKAVESFATSIKTSPEYAEAYFMLAQTFIHLKQFGQAQSVLSMAAERFPNDPNVYYLLAISFQGTNDLMPAIVAARKGLDLFKAKRDEEGEKRTIVLLGALVQMAKQQSEDKMVEGAAQAAQQAGPAK